MPTPLEQALKAQHGIPFTSDSSAHGGSAYTVSEGYTAPVDAGGWMKVNQRQQSPTGGGYTRPPTGSSQAYVGEEEVSVHDGRKGLDALQEQQL